MSGTAEVLAFWVLAALTVGSALAVVTVRSLFHAALFLVLSFCSIAGLYILLNAEFLAAVQILIYAGAISVLLIFGVMLTRDAMHQNPANRLQWSALLVAALMLLTLGWVAAGTDWQSVNGAAAAVQMDDIARALFDRNSGFVLPFEVASVLLLAAMIGAIALAKGRE